MQIGIEQENSIPNNLTIKQELFCRGAAAGKNLVDAAKDAGYSHESNHNPSMPSRMVQSDKIRNRIGVLIGEKDFEASAASCWAYLFSIDVSEFEVGKSQWSNVVDKKLKAIEQIAKLAGWEPNKTVETKSLILKGSLDDLLPTSK